MSGDSSEEKTLPPSRKKLDEARKKGQVPKSKDLVGAATICAGFGAAWVAVSALFTSGAAMLDAAGNVAMLGMGPGLRVMGASLNQAFNATALPAMVMVVGAALVGNVVVLRGVVFSMDPISPKLTNVSPTQGFKKIFGVKALVELVKNLLKAVCLAATLALVLWGGLRPLVLAPSCGLGCVLQSARVLAVAMMGASALIFLAGGGLDMLLQRWLFMRDQKMGVSEQKREMKEQEGDPHIKRERRRTMNEAAQAPSKLGTSQANLMVEDGSGTVVGLRFIRGETPVPMVVCRAKGDRAAAMAAEARSRGVKVAVDAKFVKALMKGAPPGAFIPQSTYAAAVGLLSKNGLV